MSRVDNSEKETSLSEMRAALHRQIEELSTEFEAAGRLRRGARPILEELEHDDKQKVKVVKLSIREYLIYGGRVIGFRGIQNAYAKERINILSLSDDAWQGEAEAVRESIQGFNFPTPVRSLLLDAIPKVRPFRPGSVSAAASVPHASLPPKGRLDRKPIVRKGAFDLADEAGSQSTTHEGEIRESIIPKPPVTLPVEPVFLPLPAAVPAISGFRAASPGLEEALYLESLQPTLVSGVSNSESRVASFSENTQTTPRVSNWNGDELKEQLGLDKLRASLEQKTCFSWLLSLIQPGRQAAKARFLGRLNDSLSLSLVEVRESVLGLLDEIKDWPEHLLVIAGYCSRVAKVITRLEKLGDGEQAPTPTAAHPGSSHSG